MKYEIFYPTGNEFCIQCGEQIKEPYIKLNQNRWAKPKICVNCLKGFVESIEQHKPMPEKKSEIIFKPSTINKNSWMMS